MLNNPFSEVDKFVNDGSKAIASELSNLDKLSEQGVDITAMLDEMKEKVEQIRKQSNEMIELIFNNPDKN